ncbi:MAG TPA: hypothetical protein VFU72_03545 [Nitrolancea sp.]|nr:hypothetical protein [Nitrolancea sp.]
MPAEFDPAYAARLLARQQALTREASQVIERLQLRELLARAGEPFQIGSSRYGLMVWRDLDFSILCAGSAAEAIASVIAALVANPLVRRLDYLDETGPRSPSGLPGDQRHYVVLRAEPIAGQEWKIDLSFWIAEGQRGELEHPSHMAERLTEETRLRILHLKDRWHRLPGYPDIVSASDIYDAVLEHGVRTPDELARYCEERGLPSE